MRERRPSCLAGAQGEEENGTHRLLLNWKENRKGWEKYLHSIKEDLFREQ